MTSTEGGSEGLSGPDVAFIYPDLKTGFVGWFDSDAMVSAKKSAVVAWRKVSSGMMELKVEETAASSHGYGFETRSYETLCAYPNERDPYEAQTVECRPSSIFGAGEGLFMLRPVPSGTVVAFYHGVRLPEDQEDCDDSWEDCAYRIFVDEQRSQERIDMPIEYLSTEKYSATLGHKV